MFLNMIIRPARSSYPEDSAQNGHKHEFGGHAVTKKVFTINNPKNEKLCCSYYN